MSGQWLLATADAVTLTTGLVNIEMPASTRMISYAESENVSIMRKWNCGQVLGPLHIFTGLNVTEQRRKVFINIPDTQIFVEIKASL